MLAWSLSFLCSIFTLRNLGKRKEHTAVLPPLFQTASGDLPASRAMENCPHIPAGDRILVYLELSLPPAHRTASYWWMACRNFLWCFLTLAWSIFFSSLVCL